MLSGPIKIAPPKFGAILIADDHEVFRFGLAEVLRHAMGATRVDSVGTFADALHALTAKDVQLAIFDLRIPGLDSPRELVKVRNLRPDLRVIVLSGSESREDILTSLAAGVHGYIVKNECTQMLVERIKYIMTGEIYVPPSIADLNATAPSAPSRDGANGLTGRQAQVLGLIAKGHSNKEIAKILEISESTVKMHVANTLRAVGASNRTHAATIYRNLFG